MLDHLLNRPRFFGATSFLVLALLGLANVNAALVPEMVANQAGLTRAWYTQAQVDSSRYAITGARLEGSTLYVLSSSGQVQALDSETGQTLWTARFGEPEQPTYGPAAHGDHVALICGSTLYVLDATNGKEIFHKLVDGAPGGSPALADDYVFAPLVSGLLHAYPIGKKKSPSKRFSSVGSILTDAIIVDDQVIWCSTRGILYSAYATGKGMNFRFDSADHLLAPVTSHDKTILVASSNGYVYGLDARHGNQRWRTSVGTEITEPAMAIDGVVYVGTLDQTLYAIDATNGKEKWSTPGVNAVVSVTAGKTYAVGQHGNLAVIDSATGDTLSSWPNHGRLLPVQNNQTDRLYFVSADGLVQCFHELGVDKPLYHGEAAKAASSDEEQPTDQPAEDAGAFESEFTAPNTTEEDSNPFGEDFNDADSDEGGFDSSDTETDEESDPFGSDGDDDPFADF